MLLQSATLCDFNAVKIRGEDYYVRSAERFNAMTHLDYDNAHFAGRELDTQVTFTNFNSNPFAGIPRSTCQITSTSRTQRSLINIRHFKISYFQKFSDLTKIYSTNKNFSRCRVIYIKKNYFK